MISQTENEVPPAIRKVELQNLFSFRAAETALSSLNVLVGPNGSGKSNLLKVFSLIGTMARSDLLPAIDRFGGYERLLFNGVRRQSQIKIRFEADVTKYASQNARDVYEIIISRRQLAGRNIISRQETLIFKRYAGRGRRITVNGRKICVEDTDNKQKKRSRSMAIDSASAGLATIRRLGDIYGSEQTDALANLFETFRVFEIDARRVSQPVYRSRVVGGDLDFDGSNLAAYLYSLSKKRPDLLDAIRDDLAAVTPSIRDLKIRLIGAGSDEGFVVEILERGLSDSTPLVAASFGTIRALALFAMLHDPNPPRLTCIEEIDHGLHPYALDRVVDRLRDAAERTQIIAVTHSPALVNRLDPNELIVFERNRETGETIIPAVDPEVVRVAGEEAGLGLGEMWFSGVLGGTPL